MFVPKSLTTFLRYLSFIFQEWDGGGGKVPMIFDNQNLNQFITRATLDICATFKDEEIPSEHS